MFEMLISLVKTVEFLHRENLHSVTISSVTSILLLTYLILDLPSSLFQTITLDTVSLMMKVIALQDPHHYPLHLLAVSHYLSCR